jgi:dsRNA-specific ribonuclease
LSGGGEKESVLATAFEAVLGAVYLEGGLPAARAVVGRLAVW